MTSLRFNHHVQIWSPLFWECIREELTSKKTFFSLLWSDCRRYGTSVGELRIDWSLMETTFGAFAMKLSKGGPSASLFDQELQERFNSGLTQAHVTGNIVQLFRMDSLYGTSDFLDYSQNKNSIHRMNISLCSVQWRLFIHLNVHAFIKHHSFITAIIFFCKN